MTSPGSSSGHRAPADGGVIEVRIRERGQLFNSMDPSPFHEKELDADAKDYIVGSAKELPTQSPAILLVHLDQPAGLPNEERIVQEAIRAHFTRQSERLRRDLRDLLRRGWKSLVIGLVFLGACCNERGFVQFHHVDPHSVGGEATVENIQLRCGAHNRYEGEQFYGHGRPTHPTERRTRPGKSQPPPP